MGLVWEGRRGEGKRGKEEKKERKKKNQEQHQTSPSLFSLDHPSSYFQGSYHPFPLKKD